MIFFDLDGTLINHERAANEAGSWLHRRLETGHELPSFLALWETIIRERMHHSRDGSFFKIGPECMRQLSADFDLPTHSAEQTFVDYLAVYVKSCTLYEDVVQCLANLLGRYRLGVISNGDYPIQQQKISHLGLQRFFEIVVVSEQVGVCKPALEIFHQACEAAHLLPHEAIHVGDDLACDVLGADEAGLQSVWLNRRNLPHGQLQLRRPLVQIHNLISMQWPLR